MIIVYMFQIHVVLLKYQNEISIIPDKLFRYFTVCLTQIEAIQSLMTTHRVKLFNIFITNFVSFYVIEDNNRVIFYIIWCNFTARTCKKFDFFSQIFEDFSQISVLFLVQAL